MKLSVVIPTFNRKDRLHRVLDPLRIELPEIAGGAEVVVVDDGSTDGTFESLSRRVQLGQVRVFRQTNQGPGAARNLGAREATGEIVLFLDDDMIPLPGLMASHLGAHDEHRDPDFHVAVLGYPTWSAKTRQEARFYRHLNESGLYFGYGRVKDPNDLPFDFFYTCNTSLPREAFLAYGGFDTDFPKAAFEDVEFGYRAIVRGRPGVPRLKLVLCRRARTVHEHPITYDEFIARQRGVARYLPIFARKHPELCDWLRVDAAIGMRETAPWSIALMEKICALGEKIPIPVPTSFYGATSRWSHLRGLCETLDATPDFRMVDEPVRDLEA